MPSRRKLGGYLHGGMTSWRQEKRPTEQIERLEVTGLPDRLAADSDVQVLGVRDRKEWDAGHLPGSVLRTWHDIDALPEGLDADRPIAVICGSGQRASTAAGLLARFGADQVIHVVDGGVPKLGRLGVSLETSSEPAAV